MLAATVQSHHCCRFVAVRVHEEDNDSHYLAEMRIFFDRRGMVVRTDLHRRISEQIARPPDDEDLRREILRRIRKFTSDFNVSFEAVRYVTVVDHDKAIEAEALALPPVWEDAGMMRIGQENLDRQRHQEETSQALKLYKEGEARLAEGHFKKAVRLFRDAIRINPGFYMPYLSLAEIYMRAGKFEDAEGNLKQAETLLLQNRGLKRKLKEQDQQRINDARTFLTSEKNVGREARAKDDAGNRISSFVAGQNKESPSRPVDWPSGIKVSVSFESIPAWLIHAYEQKNFDPLNSYNLRLEAERLRLFEGFDELLAPLYARIDSYEHQLRTARIVLRRMRGRALLCDEVGLGKTIEAGLVLKEYVLRGMVSKVLILAVPALISQWQSEMTEKFDLSFVTTDSLDRFTEPQEFWRQPFVIASLAVAKREPHQSLILDQGYDLVIVDEAHHVRNRRTLAWKFLNQLKKKFLLLLTATPLHNDLEELYNLITLLRPGQLGTPRQFKGSFTEHGNLRKPKNLETLRVLMRDVMVRHTRASVTLKLPRRIARTVPVELTDAEAHVYEMISTWVRDFSREQDRAHRFLTTVLQREAGSSLRAAHLTLTKLHEKFPLSNGLAARLGELIETIPEVQESSKLSALRNILTHASEKCLVFTEFLETQAFLASALAGMGLPFGVFNGSMSAEEKAKVVCEFETNGRILILTPSGGEGTNLQFCQTLVNYDLPWNPMKIEQRIGRIHRIGQTGEVLIYNFAAKNTVEHYLLKILDEKLNLFELVVGEAETILGELAEDKDFEEMLMDIWLETANAKELESKIEDFGNKILEQKKQYLETKHLDETLFMQDYETV